ncbi:MAG TPA: CPBP family intramembrane glutamic endopeptidase [Thermoanaerobaculia bacterium]
MRWIAPAGYLHLFLFGILIPISAIRSKKLLESRPLPPRRKYFISVFIQVGCFALFSIAVAHLDRIEVFPRAFPPLRAIVAGVVFLALAVMFGWTTWRKAVLERERVVALFMPANNVERLLWIGSAALAGFGEEITWRGVQTALLTRLTGSVAVAIILAIAMFAVAHAMQGWKSVGVIAIFTAGFHALVWLSGSLYVAMVVHFIYDLIAGFSYAHFGRKFGYVIPTREDGEGSGRGLSATDPV